MARHPEVSEKEIIQAGQELESAGKMANPGAIRAHLGYRGGLLRIKEIWESFQRRKSESLHDKQVFDIDFEALPEDYAQNAGQLITRVTTALEQMTIEAYMHSQQLFEKRIKALEKSHAAQMDTLRQAEIDADRSITNLEDELELAQSEAKSLAEQNAKLLIENAELKGRLSAFESK
ncbi:DNA-binding protein [Alteromonas sp. CYL-A6]|uniref:DNA-binding protein n=1 Tax=Alteromonas nitratireducens TaxID=3390813 RepID=UPI0034A80175